MKLNVFNDDLISAVDGIFTVGEEMIKDNGEDSYFYSLNMNYGLIGVFDGCGGIGSRKYPTFNNKTGAYIGSHITAMAVRDWFARFSETPHLISADAEELICGELKRSITTALKDIESKTTSTTIKGSLTKNLPTTASMVIFQKNLKDIEASFVWAGDSRGYVLDEIGLAQITVDDIDDGEDALSNLTGDGRLTNEITSDGDYKLNIKSIACSKPAVFITATDGCFAYFTTPMEFEFMLLETLVKSKNINEWKQALNKYIKKYAGDDYTMSVAVFGYGSYDALKKSFMQRYSTVKLKYISGLSKCSDEEKLVLWNEYKKQYYRGV